ncbi:Cyclin-dependent kinase 20 [Linnemannia zychae]|nr:Cyclin-dependent kinase 20 [Linnemannia zychae]
MQLLNTIKVLHENPYTADKISKIKVIHLDPSLLRDTLKEQQAALGNSTGNESEQRILAELGLDQDTILSSEAKGSGQTPNRQTGPELVAVKFLSCTVSYGDEFDSSSDEDEPEEDSQDKVSKQKRFLAPGWTAIGQNDIPKKVRFGIKPKREIAALRAAQGHSNVVPFLGLTGLKKINPFTKPARQQDEGSSPAPLGFSKPSSGHGGSLFGSSLPALGRSLFQQGSEGHPSSSIRTFLQPSPNSFHCDDDAPKSLSTPFNNNSGWDSEDYYSEDEASDDNQEIDYTKSSYETRIQYLRRIFSRQPGPGGIILPLVYNSLYELIRIGWTKTRPFMAETCMLQILDGLAWIHDEGGLIHRDISAGNILVTIAPGGYRDEQMKVVQDRKDGMGRGFFQCLISDFGCATFQPAPAAIATTEPLTKEDTEDTATNENIHQSYYRPMQKRRQGLTFDVGTRAYRAPELLFSSSTYTTAVDIWSAGVLFAELYMGKHLFKAESDIGQVCAIVKVLGTPTRDNWPEYETMPDYGKLIFQALETTDLSSILIGPRKTTATTIATTDNGSNTFDSLVTNDNNNHGDNMKEVNNVGDEPAPPTLISEASFRLIEQIVTYSEARRPSARQALTELASSLSSADRLSLNQVYKGFLDEQGRPRQVQEEPEKKITESPLSQCILDVKQAMDELRKLRDNEESDSEDELERSGGYGEEYGEYYDREFAEFTGNGYDEGDASLFMFGRGGYSAEQIAKYEDGDNNKGNSDDDDGQRSIRSDDFSRYDEQTAMKNNTKHDSENTQEQDQQPEQLLDEDKDHGSDRGEHGHVSKHGESEIIEGSEDEDGGPLRAIKRQRGVSSDGSTSINGEKVG